MNNPTNVLVQARKSAERSSASLIKAIDSLDATSPRAEHHWRRALTHNARARQLAFESGDLLGWTLPVEGPPDEEPEPPIDEPPIVDDENQHSEMKLFGFTPRLPFDCIKNIIFAGIDPLRPIERVKIELQMLGDAVEQPGRVKVYAFINANGISEDLLAYYAHNPDGKTHLQSGLEPGGWGGMLHYSGKWKEPEGGLHVIDIDSVAGEVHLNGRLAGSTSGAWPLYCRDGEIWAYIGNREGSSPTGGISPIGETFEWMRVTVFYGSDGA